MMNMFRDDSALAPPLHRAVSSREMGCLIICWSVIGFFFVFGGVFFLFLPPQAAFLLGVLLDLMLTAALIGCVCVMRGSRQALFAGALLSQLLIIVTLLPFLNSQWLVTTWGMTSSPMRSDWHWRVTLILLHGLLPIIGGISWVVARSIESMRRSAENCRSDAS